MESKCCNTCLEEQKSIYQIYSALEQETEHYTEGQKASEKFFNYVVQINLWMLDIPCIF